MVLSLAALLAGGCSIFQDFGYEPEGKVVVLPPLAERPRLDPISRNYFILESPDQSVVGEPQIVFSRDTDTFPDLAREYGLGYDELVEANPGIDPWVPGANTPILLPTQYVLPDVPRQGIVLNIASKRLFYFPKVNEGEPIQVLTYPIGIGRVGWETPVGEAKVVAKQTDPTWYVPESVLREHEADGDPLPAVVPPGPDNPLGRHSMRLDLPGYLVHGTNMPWGVGMRVSHGCVRLYPENVEVLYSLVNVGEKVNIINEPYLAGWRNSELFFESHRPLEDDAVSPGQHLQAIFEKLGDQSGAFTEQEEKDHAEAIASEALGVPIRVLAGDAQEVFERARIVKNTVTIDPEAPTLAEVRELLEEAEDELAVPEAVSSD
jgi:L,D-transpeptidase ErfK/SrfK